MQEDMGIYHFDSWAANFGEVTTALAIMAVPFFWRTTGEKQTEQLISEFEKTLEDDYDEE